MKIAIWHNLTTGGGKRALEYHIQALLNRGHELEIWEPDTAITPIIDGRPEIKVHILPLRDKLAALPEPTRSWQHSNHKKKKIQLLKTHCSQCAKEINAGEYDIVLVNSCSIFYMSFIGEFLKIPTAIYLGEPFRMLYEAMPEQPWAAKFKFLSKRMIGEHIENYAKRIQVAEEKQAAASYNRILVNSFFSRESVMRTYALDSRVCYLGIRDDFFISGNLKKPYVVSVGYAYSLKGMDRAIMAVSTIDAASRPKLVWIANGQNTDYAKKMKLLSKDKGVDLQILVGISDEELRVYVSEAAVMIYTPRLEPFGFAPLEANALGTSVVGIAEAGVRESILNGSNGYLANDENYKVLGSLVEGFVRNLEYAKSEGQKARSHVLENWNFERLTNNIENALKELISDSQRNKTGVRV